MNSNPFAYKKAFLALRLFIVLVAGFISYAFIVEISSVKAFDIDVLSVSPSDGSIKVALNSPIEIEVNNTYRDNIGYLFSIEPEVRGKVTLIDNKIRFEPWENYQYGVDYTVKLAWKDRCLAVLDGTECNEEVFWSSIFRTQSHRRIAIGNSVQGRAIFADIFGSGEDTIFYVSALHGSEPITINIANKWTNYLKANEGSIPQDKTLVIIAVANPDGLAYGIRWNANHVDLNRNWPASDWQPHTWWGTYYCLWCGGPFPLSERESKALYDFYTKMDIDVLISYHSAGNVVLAGDTSHADSVSWAVDYANLSGIPYGEGGWSAYPVTGDMNFWAVEALGITSVLIENPSNTNDYFSSHLPALIGTLNK